MSRWFRHYAGMMRDEKLVRVSIKSNQPIERVLWVWGAILESAAEIDDAGRFDLDGDEAAYFLRTDAADIHSVLVALTDAGRLVGDRVAKWDGRQFTSDRSATRQAAYRKRQRELRGCDDPKEASDVTITSPSQPDDAPETELETETDIPEANASGRSAIDFQAAIFKSGKALLKAAYGCDDRQAGSTLGRIRKEAKDDALVLRLLAECEGKSISDPTAWLLAAVKQRKGNGQHQTHQRASVREIAERAVAGRNGPGDSAAQLLPGPRSASGYG